MIKFKKCEKTAAKDRTVFGGWEKRAILSSMAAREIAKSNDLDPETISITEFEEMAARLGYWRTR